MQNDQNAGVGLSHLALNNLSPLRGCGSDRLLKFGTHPSTACADPPLCPYSAAGAQGLRLRTPPPSSPAARAGLSRERMSSLETPAEGGPGWGGLLTQTQSLMPSCATPAMLTGQRFYLKLQAPWLRPGHCHFLPTPSPCPPPRGSTCVLSPSSDWLDGLK